MDVYGNSTSDHVFQIDDLLDFSNEQIFSSAPTPNDALPPPPPLDVSVLPQLPSAASHEFAHDLYFPSDDAAELEWLSRFADDSFADDIPANSLTNTVNARSDGAFSGKTKVKRSRSVVVPSSAPRYGGDPAAMEEIGRRCTHCASEKTPQWRTGPMGPMTLCNACGVRFKSGRLVPEYRPAASPTFVLTQHSNSHRKVMELRRQKEVRQRQPDQMYGHHHHHHRSQPDFEVC